MDKDAPAAVHAPELTTLDSLPGSVTLASSHTFPFADLSVLDLGPNTSTERFSVPPIYEHVILMTVEGSTYGEERICGQFFTGQAVPGRLTLLPAGADSEWRICSLGLRNIDLFLSSPFLKRVAAQTLAMDPARAAPDPKAFFEDPLLFHIGMAISHTIRDPGYRHFLYLESLCHTLAVHLLHNYAGPSAAVCEVKGRMPAPVLKQILDYIADSPNSDLSLSHMADLAHVSPFYFSRLFKKSMGQTVHQYVLAQRLELSYRLLLRSNLTIARIADEAGFADESHFIRHFKFMYGVPPGALRRDRRIIP